MDKVLDRLKVLIDSSTTIVVMETVEEVRAVRLVRAACADLNLAAFEWTITSGLGRSGGGPVEPATSGVAWPRAGIWGKAPRPFTTAASRPKC